MGFLECFLSRHFFMEFPDLHEKGARANPRDIA